MSSVTSTTGSAYWRSLDEIQQTPEFREFVEREFPVAASDFPEGISRRRWLQLMGASLALGGLTGCRWEKEKIAPFAVRPENRVPGEAEYFATSIEFAGMPRHLLVTCYDGRPIKVEGNPEHPASEGATDVFSQASILGLYDPDRSDSLRERDGRQVFTREWDDFARFAEQHFRTAEDTGREGVALLVEPTSSATVQSMLRHFRNRFPNAAIYAYSSISRDQEIQGAELAFGRPLRTRFELAQSKVIACLDADVIGMHPHSLAHARDYAEGRNPDSGGMNRLYVVESQFTVTGAAADHRLPLKSHDIGLFLAHLDRLIRTRLSRALDSDAPARPVAAAVELPPLHSNVEEFVSALADDLLDHRGESLIAVGRNQPASVHALAHDLNATLGNHGKTVILSADSNLEDPAQSLTDLVRDVHQGRIDSLLIMGGNPVYDAPGDIDFAELLPKIPTTIRLGVYEDETSALCTWHLPEAHDFESWCDVRGWDGTVSVRQPLIAPLLNGQSQIEVLGLICGDRRESRAIVRQAIGEMLGEGRLSDTEWTKLLHDGFLPETDRSPIELTSQVDSAREKILNEIIGLAGADMELVFTPDDSVLDGRFANNGWLQETPAPLTKLTWDNAAIVSPTTAENLGIRHGHLIRLKREATVVELPAFVLPGQAPGSIGVAIGYGRLAAGLVGGHAGEGVRSVGVNVNPLRNSQGEQMVSDFEIIPTEALHDFATTQDHHAIDEAGLAETGRRVGELVREGSLDEYEHDPDFVHHGSHHNPLESLWTEKSYDDHAWGMSIDLNKCIGCNACVVACQAENNVPVVGQEQVAKGREMHWIRVDRYFQGDVENPRITTQPVACHHCENAPCEQVCPVAATVHSDEGLNDMVYNRCVGTRYCANNCPYKVRRFNFFDYNAELDDPSRQLVQLAVNPEVTVRSRGVMEKCTYCVQRIQGTKINARNERRPIRDGEMKTACQQACPTRAIEFGDLNDPESRVAQAHNDPRAYGMLAELNVKPRTKYLARIRNLNPRLTDQQSPGTPRDGGHHGDS